MKECVIGLDLGTTRVKCVLACEDTIKWLSWKNTIKVASPHLLADLLNLTLKNLNDLVNHHNIKIKAICLSTSWPSIILSNSLNSKVIEYFEYYDPRGLLVNASESGDPSTITDLPSRIKWLQNVYGLEHPIKADTLTSYLNLKLGGMGKIDSWVAETANFLDVKSIVEFSKISKPSCSDGKVNIGGLDFLNGSEILVGSGDSFLASYGGKIIHESSVHVELGTSVVMMENNNSIHFIKGLPFFGKQLVSGVAKHTDDIKGLFGRDLKNTKVDPNLLNAIHFSIPTKNGIYILNESTLFIPEKLKMKNPSIQLATILEWLVLEIDQSTSGHHQKISFGGGISETTAFKSIYKKLTGADPRVLPFAAAFGAHLLAWEYFKPKS